MLTIRYWLIYRNEEHSLNKSQTDMKKKHLLVIEKHSAWNTSFFPVLHEWLLRTYVKFWLSLCKIVRSSVILLLPLFIGNPALFLVNSWLLNYHKVRLLQANLLRRQTSRSHYGSKVPAVTITVFTYRNKIGKIVKIVKIGKISSPPVFSRVRDTLESVNRRMTDNTMTKRKRTNGQTTNNKIYT
jgi:hypothetical protein